MKIKPAASDPKKPTTTAKAKPRKKKGRLAKQLAKMNGTSALEDEFEEILIELGEEYVHHYRFGNREFDFCIVEPKILIEIHGCFFHACPVCGKDAKYSAQKKSVKNDKHKELLVRESREYTLLTFWEHEVKKDKASVILRLLEAFA